MKLSDLFPPLSRYDRESPETALAVMIVTLTVGGGLIFFMFTFHVVMIVSLSVVVLWAFWYIIRLFLSPP